MMKQPCRRDFISDSSSSDEDSLPQISLRERLERKRAIPAQSFLNECNGKTDSQVNKSPCKDHPGINWSSINTKESQDGLNLNHYKSVSPDNSTNDHPDEMSDGSSNIQVPSNAKIRKKRTPEEIEENKRKAQEKKEQRERLKMAKEAEKQMKKAERETKKQYSLGSCLKYMTVLVDTHIVNTCGYGMTVFKVCEELGVACQTLELPSPFTIMWKRTLTECSKMGELQVHTSQNEVEEGEMLAIIPVQDFVHMVHTFKQEQKGMSAGGVTLKNYVQQLQTIHKGKNITTIVTGVEQYFRDIKSHTQKRHRDAVQSINPHHVTKQGKEKKDLIKVSRVDIEEALTDAFLNTSSVNYMVESSEDVADLVRRFTKAVAEKPAKRDRFDAKFSFHGEGASGVKVDKNGMGLLKVWKQQLMQMKNVSQDVAQALVAEYPSPLLLFQAYERCESEKEAIRLLENIVVRRGAGVLETSRRVGKELSRRLYSLFTQEDPNFVIK